MSNLMTMGACLSGQQKRWSDNIAAAHKIADSYMSCAETDSSNDVRAMGFTAQMLNNFAEKHGSYDKAYRAFGRIKDDAAGISNPFDSIAHTSNFGPWIMDVFPLITAWYPEFPLKDLISVQEMEKPLAWMFFSTLKTGTNKADTTIGEVVETALGMRQLKARYVTGEIFGEAIPADQIKWEEGETAGTGVSMAMLAYNPINLADEDYRRKIQLTITPKDATTGEPDPDNAVTYYYDSESAGKVTFYYIDNTDPDNPTNVPVDADTLSLEVTTGLISYADAGTASGTETVSSVASISADYVWNMDYATVDNIPRVKEDVEKVEMVAKERALMLEWTLFAEYLKKTQFGQDIQQDNLRRCLDLMYQYQVRYILDDMYRGAKGNGGVATDILIPSNSTYSVDVKVQKVLESLNNVANQIEIASGRMAGNRLVVGRYFKAFLESLPNTYYKAEGGNSSAFSSPRKIGVFGGFDVYFDPFFQGNGEGFMTYRGNEFYDAAYYMGMYMPLTTTDTVVLGVTAKQSFVSMEAYKYHKPNCVFKLNFAPAQA